MDSRSCPEMSCVLCGKAVDLRIDLCADEKGKSIHEHCYLKHITSNGDHSNSGGEDVQ